MDALECIKNRMSIRAFKPEPVAKEIIEEVISLAQMSPSYKNTQPWEVAVVSGAKKEALSKMMVDLLENGEENCPDLPTPTEWPEPENNRIVELFKKRFELTGIDLSDPDMVKKAKKANFNFYMAPHVVYVYQESSLTDWSLFDMGLFTQTFMLAAHAKGLGTVPQAFVTDYAQNVKEFLSIPSTKRLVLGLSLGYPDLDAPANSFKTGRSETKDIVKWYE